MEYDFARLDAVPFSARSLACARFPLVGTKVIRASWAFKRGYMPRYQRSGAGFQHSPHF
jgi:hypothetical protein